MTYTLSWAESAYKEFKKLPVLVQRTISKKLDEASQNPVHYFTKLVGQDKFKLRVGDYRVIVRIEQEQLLILVVEVGHRRNIYN